MQSRKANRLAGEASPYLQQHAHNPVDWYPWGPEALARAKAEDKPMLLSIGYSACHWCHVMERESFEDQAIAALMNELYVNVKVDREERPDLDQTYQLVVQLMGKGGGWPLTVFLTPDQRPFFGGTYFPPVPRFGMPSFPQVLRAIREAYDDKREDVSEQADELTRAIVEVGRSSGEQTGEPSVELLGRAVAKLSSRFDERHGGFGGKPKFPNTMSLHVLLAHGARTSDERSMARVKRALDAMRDGGIHDHLGGGFHRYSTDERWLVPHFEKMLYDNALLLRLYVDGFRALGDPTYADTARALVGYVLREMTHESGAFFAAQDADSEGHEGRFFVWTPDEVRAALAGDEEAIAAALACFGVTAEGNFDDHGVATGRSVLFAAEPVGARGDALARAKRSMFAAREKRPKPFRDEKLMASLNGLMIAALADAACALDERAWLDKAVTAYDAVFSLLVDRSGEFAVVARYAKDGRVVGAGFLDDYAYLARAALELYETTGDPRFAVDARALCRSVVARFHDAEAGGFFLAPHEGERLIARPKDAFDHAVPSGGAIACDVLLRLGAMGDDDFASLASSELGRLAASAAANPFAYGAALLALQTLVRGRTDVVVVGRTSTDVDALALAALREYLPDRLMVRVDPRYPTAAQTALPLTAGKPRAEGAHAFVCRGSTCSRPLATPAELHAELSNRTK